MPENKLFTASKTALALECQAWGHLPQLKSPPGQGAERGRRVHKALELYVDQADFPDVGLVGEEEIKLYEFGCRVVDRLREKGYTLRSEVALGMNLVTGASWGGSKLETDRGYPEATGMTFGTVDLIAEKDGMVEIIDWKTGFGAGAIPQLKTLAVMHTNLFPHLNVAISSVYLGDKKVARFELPHSEIQEHRGRLLAAVEGYTAKKSLPVVGPHCAQHYCPSALDCPVLVHWHKEYAQRVTKEKAKGNYDEASKIQAMQALAKSAKVFLDGIKEAGMPIRKDGQEFGPGPGGWKWRKIT